MPIVLPSNYPETFDANELRGIAADAIVRKDLSAFRAALTPELLITILDAIDTYWLTSREAIREKGEADTKYTDLRALYEAEVGPIDPI